MTDYNKQTVAQLRQLLKERGIPSTGLSRKAQIVGKLEEADREGVEVEVKDAPLNLVAQVETKDAQEVEEKPEVPGPALTETGEPAQSQQSNPPPVPTAALDANRRTVSHADNNVPPPDQLQDLERPAQDTTIDNELGAIQPVGVSNAATGDAEGFIEPRNTGPADARVEEEQNGQPAENELPEAPGPATEASRFKPQDQDTTMEDSTSAPVASEEPSVEKPELLPIPERSTAETSRLPTEELEADTKKRKRRSGSPDLPSQDIKAKKMRPSQKPAPEVHLKEDEDVAIEQRTEKSNDASIVNIKPELPEATEADHKFLKKEKSDRYKTLVGPSIDNSTQDAPLQYDKPVAPALHPATPALYIRNFMRPLRPEPLRTHLVSLASPPSSSPDASIVQSLFLDAMKTHALVLFASTAAASRVRASLHGSIWPPEGNRKELWVDFVPEDRVEDWIKQEEDAIAAEKEARTAGRSIPSKRFEVVYPSNKAIFQEVGANTTAPAHAPKGPRSSIPSQLPAPGRNDMTTSFDTLDKLFLATSSAKPNLYYLPVSDDISQSRLAELAHETSRDWRPGEVRKGRGIKVEIQYRYSFDEGDRVVEMGEDRGPWAEDLRDRRRGGFGAGGGSRGRGRNGGVGWRG